MSEITDQTALIRLPLLTNPAGNAVFLAEMTEEAIAAASFLDERLIGLQLQGRWIPRADIEAMTAELAERIDFIFHIGHVGSTLLSRLIGHARSVFALREPAILRAVAQGPLQGDETLTRGLLRLWSQSFRPRQRSVLKATSFVSEMAKDLLGREGQPKAIFLTASPDAYLATIMAGPNSPIEARSLAPMRLERLHRRLGTPAWRASELTDGEVVAMSWASEMCALAEAWAAHGPQSVLWLDFDRLLAEPRETLAAAMTHLRGAVTVGELDRMLSSPDFKRYSKAPEHAYDADLRRVLMAQAARDHASALEAGRNWLTAAASQFPPIQNALELWRKTASISHQNGAEA